MIREVSVICAILALCACGNGGGGDGTTSPTSAQALVSSTGDLSKYLGVWSSCNPQSNAQWRRDSISFSSSGADLAFSPAIGLIGVFYYTACAGTVPGPVIAVTPIAPLRISSTTIIVIAPQSNSRFTGMADELPDLGFPAFKFIGFSLDYKSLWASATNSFDGVVVRYDRN